MYNYACSVYRYGASSNVLRPSYGYERATRYGTGTQWVRIYVDVASAILSNQSRNKMVVFVQRDDSECQ